MMSVEKERVPFSEFMYPKGNVENWLCEVERIMRASMRHSYMMSNAAFEEQGESDRPGWVKDWPAMTILAVDCTWWTKARAAARSLARFRLCCACSPTW